MNIGLIDVDNHNYPNLCQMKLSAWHKANGDSVERYDHMSAATGLKHYDRVYVSKVFDGTYSSDYPYAPVADEVIRGGTGYSLTGELPYEIEHMMPDYSLYGITDTAYGFLTRGCPRHCSFCIVGAKEGLTSRKVADLTEFWDGQEKVNIMDANILACPDRLNLLDQLADSRALVDINQGIDIRLVTEEVAMKLLKLKVEELRFAWDNPREDLTGRFADFAKWYTRKDKNGKIVYVLTNYNSTMDEDLQRIYALRDIGYKPYVMIYDKPNAPKDIRRLQQWVNNRYIFYSCKKFEDFKHKNMEE